MRVLEALIRNPLTANALKGLAIGAIVLALAAAALSAIHPDFLSFYFGPLVTHCAEDGEIPTFDRRVIEGKALRFVRQVLDNDIEGAFALLSQQAKSVTSKERLREGATVIRADGPYGPISVTRSYLVDLRWGRGHGETFLCDRDKDLGGGDPPKLGAEARQAQVVVVTSNPKGQQSFTVWMHAEGATWWVGGFHSQPVTERGATSPAEN